MKRISWKKGMRLTEEVFRQSDSCTIEQVGNAMFLATAGRIGLFPQCSFNVSIDIQGNSIDVIALDCLGVTRDGTLVDVSYDSGYNSAFNTRAEMPQTSSSSRLLVSINVIKDRWHDTGDGMCEPMYVYTVTDENTPLPSNSLPIARLVNTGSSWRIDEEEFVPPCLFVSSHTRFIELIGTLRNVLSQINNTARSKANSAGREVLNVFWPTLMQTAITIDKEVMQMSPMQLLGCIQKCVGAFVVAFDLSPEYGLSNADVYHDFAMAPYNYKEVYPRIKQGIALLNEMAEKIGRFGEAAPKPAPEPERPAPTPQRHRWSGMSI